MTSTAPPLVVGDIPDRQRAALAWRIRDLLFEADQKAARTFQCNAGCNCCELVRSEGMRTSLLGLIAEMEGSSWEVARDRTASQPTPASRAPLDLSKIKVPTSPTAAVRRRAPDPASARPCPFCSKPLTLAPRSTWWCTHCDVTP